MEIEDLYLRMYNKAHRFKELVIPRFTNTEYDLSDDKIRENNSSLKEIRDQNIEADI